MSKTVAIIGRPNVGKSTLFNRLVGRRLALVDDAPGVTRDRREGDARLGDLEFRIVDTAGLDDAADETLQGRMQAQTLAAVEDADVCLFMIDARAGVTPIDHHFADLARRSEKPVILVANKCEGKDGADALYEAFALGLGEAVGLSAEHGQGMSDLFDALEPLVDAGGAEAADVEADEAPAGRDKPLRIAIIGRPNAGKSTLINRLLGEDRLLTGPEAGITRDSISVDWQWQDLPVKLFDTAGLRRRARVVDKVEKLSAADALRAVRFAEVVVLLLDACQPFEKQDLHLADLAAREGRALVLAVNKWDLIEDKRDALEELKEKAGRLLPQVRGVPLVTLSATTGKGLQRLMPAVMEVYEAWNRRVTTGELNRWLADALERHPPPAAKGRRIKLRYITQAKSRPPTFIAFCSRARELPEAYSRYLINSLREDFDIWGSPVRMQLRQGKNPYAKDRTSRS
ncbi:MAG: ribosome biogenesis GTPase Der [Hyphomicrobiales bacterium]